MPHVAVQDKPAVYELSSSISFIRRCTGLSNKKVSYRLPTTTVHILGTPKQGPIISRNAETCQQINADRDSGSLRWLCKPGIRAGVHVLEHLTSLCLAGGNYDNDCVLKQTNNPWVGTKSLTGTAWHFAGKFSTA